MRSKTLVAATATTMLALVLGGCAATPESSGPTTLTFWCWGDRVKAKVEAYNASHDHIQIELTDAGGGADSSSKLVTASRAGNAPDASCIEYQTIPAMVVAGTLADISEYTEDIKDDFSEATWNLTTFDGAVYGVPQDVGPMVFLYNKARLDELGVSAPKTWAEYADAAAQVRTADPNAYLGTFSPGEFANFAGLSQQAGASWWTVNGQEWSVGIDDSASLQVADFWGDLVANDLVKAEPLLTPEWNTALNKREILSWAGALWSPGVLNSVAPDQAGEWAIAPLPQWTEGDERVALQGGSALSVTKDSKHPKEAAEFIAWMNASEEALTMQIRSGQYPASVIGQEMAVTSDPPAMMVGQADYWDIANKTAENVLSSISWGPNVNTASSAFLDAMSTAINDGTSFADALADVQKIVVDDMEKTGFKVAD